MLLTISTTHEPATDLGYLLHKNPERIHAVSTAVGTAHVFYTETTHNRCTVALLLEVDPIGLVRGRRGPEGEGRTLAQYVNDRPYVASSFLSVAIARAFGTAMGGRSKERPELTNTPIPLEVRLPVLPSRGGEKLLRKLLEPLGYEIEAELLPLDEKFPDWGESHYFDVTLKGTVRLADLLSHLYILIPVLDNDKHYWVNEEEAEKLLKKGESWLADHPEKELIVSRYLKRQRHLIRPTLERLIEGEDVDPDERAELQSAEEEQVERPLRLNDIRHKTVAESLKASGAATVLDVGCGEGRLIRELLPDKQFRKIVAMDVSYAALERAKQRLHWERMPAARRERIELIHGSLMYRDKRLAGFDAAAAVEVIEHLDPPRLRAFERVLFEFAQPGTIVITTPNVEYNVKFETLPAGRLRHRDHRFEWTREQFQNWAIEVAGRFGYAVRFEDIGPLDDQVGAPTQMGVFTR